MSRGSHQQPFHPVPPPRKSMKVLLASGVCHRYQMCSCFPKVGSATPRRTGLGSRNKAHLQSGSPDSGLIQALFRYCVELTGIPQFVLIPAPVTTTTFRDLPKVSAMSCSSSSESGVTLIVGIIASVQRILSGGRFIGAVKCFQESSPRVLLF